MLKQAARVASAITPRLAYIGSASYSFSKAIQSTRSSVIMNPNLLSRVSKDQTMRALEFTVEQSNPIYKLESKEVIVLDKISETLDSETHRVFDLYQKKLFAVKTLHLDSQDAWMHLNIALRHYHYGKSPLANIRAFDYNESSNQVKIVSDAGKIIVNDYAKFRKMNDIPWSNPELKSLVWQLIYQMQVFKDIGVKCNYLKPDHMFVSPDGKSLELFDYPGAVLQSKLENHLNLGLNLDKVLMPLVHIIDPTAPVVNISEAEAYLKTNFPEFMYQFDQIKDNLKYSFSNTLFGNNGNYIKEEVRKSMPIYGVFANKRYEKHVLEKFRGIIESKKLPNFNENWGLINQGLLNNKEAITIFEKNLEDTIAKYGEIHQATAKAYLNLAEVYEYDNIEKAWEYFTKASNLAYSVPNMDSLLKARIFNEYGKTLWSYKNKVKEALECFKEVEKELKNTSDVSSRLAYEIKANLDYIYKTYESGYTNIKTSSRGIKRALFKVLVLIVLLKLLMSSEFFKGWTNSGKKPEEQVYCSKCYEKIHEKELKVVVTKKNVQEDNKGVVLNGQTPQKPVQKPNDDGPNNGAPLSKGEKPISKQDQDKYVKKRLVQVSEEKINWWVIGFYVLISAAGLAI